MEQIEIKDASKASKDKTESVKITLLNQELTRASLKPEFLSYFSEVSYILFQNTAPVEALSQLLVTNVIMVALVVSLERNRE